MVNTVSGEDDLPFLKDGVTEYGLLGAVFIQYRTNQTFVRSKIDPTILMDGKSGDCFQRADGLRWEWPAYKRTRQIKFVDGERTPTAWEPLEGTGAYCDDKTYPYLKARAA